MAIFKDLDERTHVFGVLTLQPLILAATATAYVDMTRYNSVQFLLGVGTNDSVGSFAMEQSTALDSNGTEAGLAFHYRKSGSIATDTMGAIVYVNSDSTAAIAASDDDKWFLIEPDQLTDGYRWCRLVVTPSDSNGVDIWAAAICKGARWSGNVQMSAS